MKDFQIINKEQLSQYKSFKHVDFRDLYEFKKIGDYPNGSGDCHDMAIVNKKRKQYMTYCSQSPFGKEVEKTIIK